MNSQTKTISQWLGTGSINIFGLPFAGKDTQGRLLADLFGGVMLSSGDILRQSQDNIRLQQIMAAGEIIPSDVWEEVVVPYFAKKEFVGQPLILSEVGRLNGEQFVVEQATNSSGHPQKAVILLSLSDKEVWARFTASQQQGDRGERGDDRHEVIQTRLEKFHKQVMPVIEYYKSKNILIDVDGSLSRQEVTNIILKKLAEKAQA